VLYGGKRATERRERIAALIEVCVHNPYHTVLRCGGYGL
jgi:hypothetical protein